MNASIDSKLNYFSKTNLEEELRFSDVEKEKMFEDLLKVKKAGPAASFPLINYKVENLIKLNKFRINLNECLKLIPKLTSTLLLWDLLKTKFIF